MAAYYNEIDQFAAEWLRNLIDAGLIAPGYVDNRSITDVTPSDLAGFTQCHFFAGIGVWSYALRNAGWDDSRPVWTGSCPCQPFSVAGKGDGFDDERHLWPAFANLIRQCKPATVLGEQVASKDADKWIDAVQDDLEAMGYAVGAVAFPSAGVGAPHIRDRMYWVGNSGGERLEGHHRDVGGGRQPGWIDQEQAGSAWASGGFSRVVFAAECDEDGNCPQCGDDFGDCECIGPTEEDVEYLERDGVLYGRRLANAESEGFPYGGNGSIQPIVSKGDGIGLQADIAIRTAGSVNGFWRDSDWLLCRDGKWRPVESVHVKVVDGPSSNMGYLCSGYCEQEEEINEMQFLSEGTFPKKIFERSFGVSMHAEAQEILRQKMHGERLRGENQSKERQERKKTSVKDEEGELRDLRQESASRASQKRESARQQGVQFDQLVRLMPQSIALAKLYGDRRTEKELRVLQQRIVQEGLVLYPHRTIQEIWASIGEKEKDSIRMGFDASRWEIVVPFPLSDNQKSRAGRLRAYGNAINAKAAQVFIECVMECCPAEMTKRAA